jgi:hypothetical protein
MQAIKKTIFLITGNVIIALIQKKKLEEFIHILGSEFDLQSSNIDCK